MMWRCASGGGTATEAKRRQTRPYALIETHGEWNWKHPGPVPESQEPQHEENISQWPGVACGMAAALVLHPGIRHRLGSRSGTYTLASAGVPWSESGGVHPRRCGDAGGRADCNADHGAVRTAKLRDLRHPRNSRTFWEK